MRRFMACVAASVVAVCAGLLGTAGAGDDPLTTAMRKQIDGSLIVFVGEAAKVEPERRVTYKVERYLKGTCFEKELVVEHPADDGGDAADLVEGRRVVVGAQLVARGPSSYALVCTAKQLAPTAWTQAVEDAVAHYVSISPSVALVPAPPSKMQLAQRKLTCMNNLSQLGQIYLMGSQENRAKAQRWSGPALFLAMRKGETFIRRGDERVLLCPFDPAARPPSTDAERRKWDDVDLAKLASPAGLCSYVGRDFVNFPVSLETAEKEPIGACLHHPGGVIVVFDGGDSQFLSLEDLGLTSDAEKIVGPESKSSLLRKLR